MGHPGAFGSGRGHSAIGNRAHQTKKSQLESWLFNYMEAPARFELAMEVLQTSALPLGDGALRELLRLLKSPVLISNRLPSVKGKNFYFSSAKKGSEPGMNALEQLRILVLLVRHLIKKVAQNLMYRAVQGSVKLIFKPIIAIA